MEILKVTDANGKQIELNLKEDILHVSHDMSARCNKNFINEVDNNVSRKAVQIVDSNDKPFSITDSLNDGDAINHIIASVEASHSDTKINASYYTGDSMLRDFTSYVSPYQKPLIKNHDTNSETIGRIIKSDCTDSSILQGTKCIDVDIRVSDKDAIEKILDGRYQTVSIGAYPKTITCQTCGHKILQDGKVSFCGHLRGNVYKDKNTNEEKECTWKMEDLDYNELSIVNSPADQYAQIYKIKVVRNSDLKKNNNSKEGENNMPQPQNTNPQATDNDLVNQILNSKNNGQEGNTKVNNDNNDGEQPTPNSTEPQGTEPKAQDEEVVKLKEENESLKAEIETLKNSNTELNTQVDALVKDNEKLDSINDQLATIHKEKMLSIVNELDATVVLEDNANIGEIHSKLAEVIKNFKQVPTTKTQEGTPKVGDNAEDKKQPQQPQKAINPGLVNNQGENVQGVEDNEEQKTQEIQLNQIKNNAKRLEDLINSAVK